MAFIAVGDKRIAETNPDLTPYALQEDIDTELENVVYKTDIAKAIDTDSTDDEVASAKAVYTELNAKADKDYGVENKGKMLVVGEDGTIVPDEPTLSTVAMTKNAWQIYDKSKLKDGQEVIITDDDDATGVIDDSSTRGDATWSSSKINASLVDIESALEEIGSRKQSVTFPFTPTSNGTLILAIGQKTSEPVARAINVMENGEAFYYVSNYFNTSWGASSTSIPLVKGKTYTVEDPSDVIMYEKTKFVY